MDGACFALGVIWLVVTLALIMRDDVKEDDNDES